MTVTVQSSSGEPVRVSDAELVIVHDDLDQPVAVFVRTASNTMWSSHIGDVGFDQVVRDLGLHRKGKPVRVEAPVK